MSPDVINKTLCFSLTRGEIGTRIDAKYFALKTIKNWSFPVITLAQIVSDEPSYGSPTRACVMDKNTDTRYIRITDFGEDGIPSNHVFMTAEEIRDEFLLNLNDILFARSGATVGKTYLHENDSHKSIFAGYCIRFIINPALALPKFVYFFTKTRAYNYWVQTIQRPAGQPNINKEEFKSLEIPIPSLEIQRYLVSKLELARKFRSDKIAKADVVLKGINDFILRKLNITLPEKNHNNYYALKVSVLENKIDAYSNQPHFRELLKRLKESQYEVTPIKELSSRIISGSTPLSGGEAYVDPPSGVRFIRSGEITEEGTVESESEIHIRNEVHNITLKRSQLKKNDVLIAIVGATIGQVGVFNYEDEANINQAIAAVSLKDDGVLPYFLCWYLKSSLGQMILDYFKRPVARANINLVEIGQIPIIVPSKKIQLEIIHEVEIRKNESQKLKLEAEEEWNNSKKWFEEKLLNGVK